MSSGTASALTCTDPRRARAAAVVVGGLPGSKVTEVLALINTEIQALKSVSRTHEAVPLATVVVVVEVLVKC